MLVAKPVVCAWTRGCGSLGSVVRRVPAAGGGLRAVGLRLRGGLVFKAHRLCVSLNSRLESNKDEAG